MALGKAVHRRADRRHPRTDRARVPPGGCTTGGDAVRQLADRLRCRRARRCPIRNWRRWACMRPRARRAGSSRVERYAAGHVGAVRAPGRGAARLGAGHRFGRRRVKIKALRILGIRGIPAAHGGFESFAQRAWRLHLVAQGWRVTVYCQEEGSGPVVAGPVAGRAAGVHPGGHAGHRRHDGVRLALDRPCTRRAAASFASRWATTQRPSATCACA